MLRPLMSRKLLLISLLITPSGCKQDAELPDAFLCTYILEPSQHYSYCKNYKTKEAKTVDSYEMKNWITTDPDSFEKMREYYKKSCE